MTLDRRTLRILTLAPAVVLVVVALVIPQMISDYWLGIIAGWIPFAVAGLGLNLLTGYNGQISIGHGAFYGVGAYTCGLLITKSHWGMWGAAAVAVVICFAVGVLVGLPALRIKGLYLALVTLAIAVVFPDLLKLWKSMTGGANGLFVTTPQLNSRGVIAPTTIQVLPPSWIHQTAAQWTFYVLAVLAFVCFVVVRNIVNSRVGRSLIAVRDNEVAAAANGVNVGLVKVLTFGVSAALAGAGGALLVLLRGQLFPSALMLTVSLYLLVSVVVGGPASIIGPAIGALFVGLFQDVITPHLPSRISEGTPLILGVVLIILMLVAPGGLAGLARQLAARVQVSRSGSDTVGVEPTDPPPEPV